MLFIFKKSSVRWKIITLFSTKINSAELFTIDIIEIKKKSDTEKLLSSSN